jgi:hypothetical protein
MAWKPETVERKTAEFVETSKQYQHFKTVDLVTAYTEIRRKKEEIEESLKPVDHRLFVLTTLIAERFDEEEIKSLKLDSGESVSVSMRTTYKIADNAKFIAWIHESGLQEELKVNSQRLQSLAGGYLSEMEQLPPGVEINEPQPKISLRKGK